MQSRQTEIESNQYPDVEVSSRFVSSQPSKIQRLSSSDTAEEIVQLHDNDVLGGRGNIINKHVGNRRFRRLITANKDAYAKCDKNSHKFFLALSIAIAIERKGGRFLKKRDEKDEDSSWIKISRKEIVAKTAQALRDQLQGMGQGRRRRSSAASVERLLKHKKGGLKPDGLQREFGDHYSTEPYEYDDDTTSCASSDDTSIDSYQDVLPIQSAFRPFMGFAELLAASSTMNPGLSTSSPHSLPSDKQSALRRKLYHQRPRRCSSEPRHNFASQHKYNCSISEQVLYQPADETTTPGGHNDRLWVPEELENLVLSDPAAVECLAALSE